MAAHALVATLPAGLRARFGPSLRSLRRRGDRRGAARLLRACEEAVEARRLRVALPLATEPPQDLPIAGAWEKIAAAMHRHPAIVVQGATGSGKSTELARIALSCGRGIEGRIALTQPRRIAARAIARRLAERCGTVLGVGVGYRTRFESQVGPAARVEVLTDGVLAATLRSDPRLQAFDTVILDEAHERSVTIDLLLGALSRALRSRRDLRVVVTSATLAAGPLATFLGGAPIIEIPGRQHPVEIRHEPIEGGDDPDGELLEHAVQRVCDLRTELGEEPGDLLVFLPGERQIRDLAELLQGALPAGTRLLPLHARLDAATQDEAFAKPSGPRVILATNVAETSLTLPWVRAVVDTGLARVSRYDPRRRLQRLRIEPISRASAAQRAGRCGRMGPGICVRLYAAEALEKRPEFTPPELLRSGLAGVILQVAHLRMGRIEEVPFPDPPSPSRIEEGRRTLRELGAIAASPAETGSPASPPGRGRGQEALTEIGQRLAALPLDPRLGRIVLGGIEENCLPESLVVAAALSVADPRGRRGGEARGDPPGEVGGAAAAPRDPFADPRSDLCSLLRLWRAWGERAAQGRSATRTWCRRHGLHAGLMREWSEVHRQLERLVESRWRVRRAPAGGGEPPRSADPVAIHRAALRGLVGMVAARVPTAEPERSGRPTRPLRPEEIGEYETADGVRLSIWPGSVLARERPEWILAGEIVETQRRWARTVAPIRARWIERLAPHLLRRETFEPHLVAETGQVAAWERTSLGGLVVVPRRRVPFGPIDPEAARQVFIAAGLVEGRWRTRGSFRVRNDRLLERIAEAEARTRRPAGILRETLVHRFYEQRVPAWVHSGPAFESWRREAERAHPEVLRMRVSDLAGDRELPSPQAFPEALMVETPGCPPLRLPLRYRHEPGHLEDGVVARVPLEALPRVERHGDGRLGWLVPGLLEEKIRGVLRALPKALRARIGTVREVAAALHADLEPTRRGGAVPGALWPPLAEALQRRIGEPISAELLEATLPRLEPHLRLGLELVDGNGGVLEFRREGDPWSRRWSEEDAGGDAVPHRLDSTAAAWTIDRLDRLPDAAVPRVVTIRSGGIEVPMHPTLSVAAPAEGPGILSLRLCGDESEALGEWREALVALFRREAAEALRHHLEYHPRGEAVIAAWSDLLAPAAPESIRDAIETLAAASCFDPDPRSVRDHRAFERRLEQASPALFPHLDETLQRLGEAAAIAADLTERLQAPAPAAWAEAVAAIELRRSDLLRIDPGAAFPQRLALLPDSLDALRQRIERLRGAGPQRDHEEEAIAAAWQGRIEALRWHRSDPRRQALLQLVDRWWIGVLAPKRVRGERVSQREVEAAIAAVA